MVIKMSGRERTHTGFVFYGILIYLFLYVPVILLAAFSFNQSKAGTLPFTGLTLHWYQDLFRDYLVIDAFKNSLLVAGVTAVLATAIGTSAAFPLVRSQFRLKETLRVVFLLPMMLPGLLIGVALLIFFSSLLGVSLSLWTVIAGHVVLTTPFVILVVTARLLDFDQKLEWAAADLGANPAQTFRLITLPIIMPGVIAGALFAFTLSLDEFVVTLFTIGSQSTLPMYIFSQVKFGVTPKVNALATLLLLGSITLLFTVFATLTGKGVKSS
jgi:spermidine/putrescine transport system permease protein